MNFSKRSRYGVRALVYLAQKTDCICMQLNDIAARNSISAKYLEQIFAMLKKSGIVNSIKGPQGGYFLADEPEKIKIADIILALDGTYVLEDEKINYGENGEAEAIENQKTIIEPVNEQLNLLLNTLTLKDLVECSAQYKEVTQDMYYI